MNKNSNLPKISAPARRALDSVGIYRLEDFSKITEIEFTELHGIGPSSIKPIKEALKAKNLNFKKEQHDH